MVKEICALSVICGVLMSVAPEGSVKKMMNVMCSLVLVSCLLLGVKEIDFGIYSEEIAKYKDREYEFIKNNEDTYENLNRAVIERQYGAYILDKATELGLGKAKIKLTAKWNTDGFWVPYYFETDWEYCQELAEYIETELGIPAQQQDWKKHE